MIPRKYADNRIPYHTTMFVTKYRYISPTTVLILGTLFFFSSFTLVRRVVSYKDNSWDVLIFTQNWPRSVCDQWLEEKHECRLVPNDTWTIHGIWPTKLGTIGPGFCNNSRPFVPEALYGIEKELETYWTPIQKHKKTTALWSHEWEKHGTCAAVVPTLSSEFQYFKQGLQWIKEYNMYTVLQKAGIVAGKQYNVTEIWDGVQKVLTKNPQVVCYQDKQNVSVLLEIRICFNKQLELVNCDGTVVGYATPSYHNLTNCHMEKLVQYPINSTVPIQKFESIDLEAEGSGDEGTDTDEKILSLESWLNWLLEEVADGNIEGTDIAAVSDTNENSIYAISCQFKGCL